MARVFAIRKDETAYQAFNLSFTEIMQQTPHNVNIDDVADFANRNFAMAPMWKIPKGKFIPYSGRESFIPDISLWTGATLVLSPVAYQHMRNVLKPSGELLPVKVGSYLFYIFNCFVFGKEDESKCKFFEYGGMDYGLKHLAFKECDQYPFLFKSAIEGCGTLFCGQQFKTFVESYRLKGIVFDTNLV